MAVVDLTTYKTTDNTPIDAVVVAGADCLEVIAKANITSGDSATSIYRIAEIPSNYVPVGGEITCDALTGLDDVDLGLYETEEHGGGVLDVDALVDGGDLTSALAPGSGLSPISAVTIANQDAALHSLVSDVCSERQSYVLALTINKDAAATGVVCVKLRLVRRELKAAS